MARIHKKMALYEVIGKKRVTVPENKKIEEQQNDKQPQLAEEPVEIENIEAVESEAVAEDPVKWPTKPRIFQLHAGRVEISMPYQLAVAVVLVIVMMALVCFRIGQLGREKVTVVDTASQNVQQPEQPMPVTPAAVPAGPIFEQSKPVAPVAEIVKPQVAEVLPQGTNVIVIQILADRKQLEPVKEFFAKNKIETEIVAMRGSNYLITKQRFEEDPQTKGSAGNTVLQQIRKLGLGYKSPPGYGSFGAKPFSGAYGMKLSN